MDLSLFTFPLNLILALLWAGSLFLLRKNCGKSGFVRFMFSKAATISAIAVLLLFCIVIGITGKRDLVNTWLFAAVLFYFQTVLFFVMFRGKRQFFHHVGLLIAVSSAFWGAPDSETFRVRALEDVSVNEVLRMDGTAAWLPYEITLKDFRTETWENGQPSMYEADLVIDDEEVTLRVNHPYAHSFGEDIYLTGTGEGYCVLQIVREPWKYGALVGIILMLAGALLLFLEGPRKDKK